MDTYQIRALELEIEQLERFKNTTKAGFYAEDKFERDQLREIKRLRELSKTYAGKQY